MTMLHTQATPLLQSVTDCDKAYRLPGFYAVSKYSHLLHVNIMQIMKWTKKSQETKKNICIYWSCKGGRV